VISKTIFAADPFAVIVITQTLINTYNYTVSKKMTLMLHTITSTCINRYIFDIHQPILILFF